MASFPVAVKTFTTKNSGDTIQPADINDLQDEVNAIEAGFLNGTAPLNSSNSTLAHLSVLGGMNVVGNSTLGSTVTIGALTYIFPTGTPSTGQVLGIISTNGSTLTLGWGTFGQVTLLKGSSGSDSNTVASTVDSIAISGLTTLDRLEVTFSAHGGSSGAGTWVLANTTDGSFLANLTNGNLAAGAKAVADVTIVNGPIASTSVFSLATFFVSGFGTVSTGIEASSIATAWTAPWTLGVRHNGTGGGAIKYKWVVSKVAGQ